ncbi:hypothetical protein, partial [Campylobacter majalis]|uniref:hypothetical protein n=1 Tax=Campylobacter majalis TaxID=2790656 RepID=UPI003D68232A
GENFLDYLNKALSYNNIDIDTKNTTINYDKTNPSNINLLNSNSIMFERLDKSKGDNSPALAIPYVYETSVALVAGASAIYTKYVIDRNLKDKENNTLEFPINSNNINNQLPPINKQENNAKDNVSITPKIQNQPINNGGIEANTEFNQPYVGGINGDEISVKIYNIDYSNKPKQKANTAGVGDILRTPKSHPNDFIKKGQNYINKETGEIWQKSNTNHYKEDISDTEWKVGLKNKEPKTKQKITVDTNGKIIKIDK